MFNYYLMEKIEDNYTIEIKDKHGIYLLNPLQDKNKKLLFVEKANHTLISNVLAVYICKIRLFAKEKYIFMIRIIFL